MMADYYIREPDDELEPVERWENEGGRLRQNDEANYITGQALAPGGGQIVTEAISAV